MNKILVFIGFLASMSGVFGMEKAQRKAEFSYEEGTDTVVFRNAGSEDFKEHEDELDTAPRIEFHNCDLSRGVCCSNADSLVFDNCDCIKTYEDVLEHVGLYYYTDNFRLKINGCDINY